jgi:micrococcal nuclease
MTYQDNYIRKAKCINVVDGDTIDVDIDLGFYTSIRQRFRLLRVNTPEVYGEQKLLGLASKALLLKVLNKEMFFQSFKTDSFKRLACRVWLSDVDGSNKYCVCAFS